MTEHHYDEHHEQEKMRVALIASAVIDELSKRYQLTPGDVAETVNWVREHKEFVAKMKHGGYMTMIGTLITATMLVALEGLKSFFGKGGQ